MSKRLRCLQVLVLVVGAGVLGTAAVAAPPGSTEDAAGDATGGAPDITTARIAANSNAVTFKISLPGTSDLTGSIILGVDSDANTGTGCAGPGWDYELRVSGRPNTVGPDNFEIGRSLNLPGDCSYDYSIAQRLTGTYDSKKQVLTVIAPRDIFTASGFRFDVFSTDGGGGQDFTAVWTYMFKK